MPCKRGYFWFQNEMGREDGFHDSSFLRMIHAVLLASALLRNAPKFPNRRKYNGDKKGGKQGRAMAETKGA